VFAPLCFAHYHYKAFQLVIFSFLVWPLLAGFSAYFWLTFYHIIILAAYSVFLAGKLTIKKAGSLAS
jgi:hypothetical protein